MSFDFNIMIDEKVYELTLNNDGTLALDDPDFEDEIIAVEMGFAPGPIHKVIVQGWETIIDSISEYELTALIEMLESDGLPKREEIGYNYSTCGYDYDEYIYRFSMDEFIKHVISPAIEYLLKEDDDDIKEAATFLAAIRMNNKPLSFELEDSGFTDEWSPEAHQLYSFVKRTLFAEGIEISNWQEEFLVEIYDPVFFESDIADWNEQTGIAGSSALKEMITALGIGDEEIRLNKEACENIPKPYHPISDSDGDIGVMYEYTEEKYDPVTNTMLPPKRVIEVVPYWDYKTALSAKRFSEYIISEFEKEDQDWEITIVRRLGALEEIRARNERLRDESQCNLFSDDIMDQELVRQFDPGIDVWVPLDEENDDTQF